MMQTHALLVRVLVAKVANLDRVMDILRNVPVKDEEPECNCVYWVKNALEALDRDKKALGTRKIGWELVRDTAMKYVEDKKAQNRFEVGSGFDTTKAPALDLLENRETIP